MNSVNPFEIFSSWFNEASQTAIDKPNAMTLGTVSDAGVPVTRIVLLSSFDDRGFVFHTNYNSHKGQQLSHNNKASLLFWWDETGHQIRIEGLVSKTSAEESDAYFASRPRGSQIGAWASEQSTVINSRDILEDRVLQLTEKYQQQDVPRPPHWGGYRVVPEMFEFWINRDSRLHDRTEFKKDVVGQWQQQILSP